MRRADLEAVAEVVKKHDLFVLSDEIYSCLLYTSNIDHVLRTHFMTAVAANAIGIIDHSLVVTNRNGMLRTALRAFTAAHALCRTDLRRGRSQTGRQRLQKFRQTRDEVRGL